MRLWLSCIVTALALGTTPAQADWAWHYGAVVCAGNAAMVRFTRAYDEEAPAFSSAPAPFARRFADAQIGDPSQCHLRDGRLVTLRHANDRDGRPYGMNGGVDTEWFTLTIGDRTIYRHETFIDRDFDRLDLVVVYDRGHLTECRTREGDVLTAHDIPLRCTDVSSRLSGDVRADISDPRPGLRVERAAANSQAFCEGLIQPASIRFQPPNGWTAFMSTEPRDHIEIADSASSPLARFDLDNDGQEDAPIPISGESGYFDGQFWMLPPPGQAPNQQAIEAASNSVISGNADAARAAGWRIFAGDQTAYREPRYTWLEPIFLNGQTLMITRWASSASQPPPQVLRPHADGSLEEVCAFQLAP